jgi:hypothetical protein
MNLGQIAEPKKRNQFAEEGGGQDSLVRYVSYFQPRFSA